MNVPDNFLGLQKEFCEYNKSKVVILPVHYEGTVTYGKGTSKGPQAIIEASKNMELFDEELQAEPYEIGIHTLRELKPEKTPEEMVNKIKEEALKHKDKFIVMLGGEHSITTGLVKALKQEQDFSVLQLDAHSDLRPKYEGSEYNHASVMSRVKELVKITQVGIRSMDKEEFDLLPSVDTDIFYAKDIVEGKRWMKKVVNTLHKNVFITIDIDVFDPSIMPSTGTPEPGGLGWYPVLELLKLVCKRRNVIGFDVVELAPNKENPAPDFLAAKLVYKLVGYKFF